MTQFRRPGNAKAFKPGILANAIKGFNHEWAAITSLRDMRTRDIIGWKFQTECGVERKFPNGHWDDPYGAAVQAIESHRCGHGR